MLTHIAAILQFTHNTIVHACQIVLLIGFVIVQLLNVATNACVVFYEAVAQFAGDCCSILEQVNTVGWRSGQTVLDAVLQTVDVCAELLITGRLARDQLPDRLVAALAAVASATRSFITLIGDSVWLLLTFVPNVLLFAVRSAFVVGRSAVQSVRQFFAEMPTEAVAGFALFIGVVALRTYTVPLIWMTMQLLFRHLVLPTSTAASNYLHAQFRLAVQRLNEVWARWFCWPRWNVRRATARAGGLLRNATTYRGRKPSSDVSASDSTDAARIDNVCVICTDRPKTMVMLPCRHLCLCADCSQRLLFMYQQTCPMCRQPVAQSLQVFT